MPGRVRIVPPPEADRDFVGGIFAPGGMGVRFFLAGDAVEGEWTVTPDLEGWTGLAHGTAFAALHDEAAIYALAYLLREVGFTQRLSVRFLRPIRLGEAVRVRGRIVRAGPRSATVGSEILAADASVVSTAETDYAVVDADTLRRVLGRPLSPFLERYLAADRAGRLELALARSREVLAAME